MTWVAVEGVVGAGKTTTATLVADRHPTQLLLENSARHPLLADFYRDPTRHALATELIFNALHLHQLDEAPTSDLLSDFSPAKNLIFGRLNLVGEDLSLVAQIDRHLWSGRRPDHVVFLDVPMAVCLSRTRARGRPYEQGLTIEDLEAIRSGYLAGLESLGQTVSTLALNGREQPEKVAEAVLALV